MNPRETQTIQNKLKSLSREKQELLSKPKAQRDTQRIEGIHTRVNNLKSWLKK